MEPRLAECLYLLYYLSDLFYFSFFPLFPYHLIVLCGYFWSCTQQSLPKDSENHMECQILNLGQPCAINAPCLLNYLLGPFRLLILVVLFGVHIQWCSWLTPISALNDNFSRAHGDHMWWQALNLDWPHARHASYLLFYYSDLHSYLILILCSDYKTSLSVLLSGTSHS